MDGIAWDDQEDTANRHVGLRTGLVSIIGFWAFYTAIVTLRASAMHFPNQAELATRRLLVTAVGIVATLLLWAVLRQFDRHRLSIRISVAAIACIPAAIAFAAANFYFFNVYDPGALPDVEQMATAGSSGMTIYDSVTMMEIIETAIWRYFFLIAWAALYLAISYAGEVRLAERRTAAFARAAQTAELRALRYQVNPHFLFNTLNSLSALVMNGRNQEAESMIMNLATFYRSSLSGDTRGDASLSDEIDVQQRYLDIEAVRFPGRLTVEIDLPPALANCAVPGLILQPLVENVIKHGVSKTSRPVRLAISAREDKGRLVLAIADNAPNVPTPDTKDSGIGLANVRQRLAARYGDAASLRIAPGEDAGFLAEIILPLEPLNG